MLCNWSVIGCKSRTGCQPVEKMRKKKEQRQAANPSYPNDRPITFYPAHHAEIDEYLEKVKLEYEAKRQAARDADQVYYKKIAEARRQMLPV